jgi:hypothetical protein
MKMKFLLLLLAIASVTAPQSQAATMLQRSGEISFQCCSFAAYATSWSQDRTWSNVRIDMDLYNNDNDGSMHTGVALLLNSLGPGTTEAANEIDDTVVAVTGFGQQTVTLFDGLTLGAGTYYVVYYRSSYDFPNFLALAQTAWPDSESSGVGITPGVDSVEDIFNDAPYRPAGTFNSYADSFLLLNITGTPEFEGAIGEGSEVPEPSTTGLAFFGLAGFAAWLRRKRR